MLIADPLTAEHVLRNTSYYRLSAYTFSFEVLDTDGSRTHKFNPGTTFSEVKTLYDFDKSLRQIIFNAVSELEIALRSRICLELSNHHGSPFFYTDKANYTDKNRFHQFEDIYIEIANSNREIFIVKFREKYSNGYLPFWHLIEVLTFGQVSYFFKSLNSVNQSVVSKSIQLNRKFLRSWIDHISYLRNLCAHHSRLWNRRLTKAPKKTKISKQLEDSKLSESMFVLAKLLHSCDLPISFIGEVEDLVTQYPDVSLSAMGFTNIRPSDIYELIGA